MNAIISMFMRELPQDLNLGRVPLTPLDRAARFVTACDACGEFTPRRVVVLCGHMFCVSCCRTQETPEGLQLFCVVCKQQTVGEQTEIGEQFLRSMKFACSCGHEGTLAEIKAHLAKGDIDHQIVDEVVLTDETFHKNVPSDLQQLQRLRLSEPAMATFKCKAYFCFELQRKIDEFMLSNVTQETAGVSWLNAEYPVEVFCKIASFATERFLGVYIRMLSDHPSYSPWPVRKLVSFELYNTNGDTVQKKEAATAVDGKIVWKGFTFACRPNGNKGWGFKKFCSLDRLVAPDENLMCNGSACIAVEFQDLD